MTPQGVTLHTLWQLLPLTAVNADTYPEKANPFLRHSHKKPFTSPHRRLLSRVVHSLSEEP